MYPESRKYENKNLFIYFHGMKKCIKVKFDNQETLFQVYNVLRT